MSIWDEVKVGTLFKPSQSYMDTLEDREKSIIEIFRFTYEGLVEGRTLFNVDDNRGWSGRLTGDPEYCRENLTFA